MGQTKKDWGRERKDARLYKRQLGNLAVPEIVIFQSPFIKFLRTCIVSVGEMCTVKFPLNSDSMFLDVIILFNGRLLQYVAGNNNSNTYGKYLREGYQQSGTYLTSPKRLFILFAEFIFCDW